MDIARVRWGFCLLLVAVGVACSTACMVFFWLELHTVSRAGLVLAHDKPAVLINSEETTIEQDVASKFLAAPSAVARHANATSLVWVAATFVWDAAPWPKVSGLLVVVSCLIGVAVLRSRQRSCSSQCKGGGIDLRLVRDHAAWFRERVLESARKDKDHVQVVTSPRGFGKTTLARSLKQAAGTCEAGIFGLLEGEQVDYWDSEHLAAGMNCVDHLLEWNVEAFAKASLICDVNCGPFLRMILHWLSPFCKTNKTKSVLILDDVLKECADRKAVSHYFNCIKKRLDSFAAVVMFTSNEGISYAVEDRGDYQKFMCLRPMPQRSDKELKELLAHILFDTTTQYGGADSSTFHKELMPAGNENRAALGRLVATVVDLVPARYAYSLRFWDLLLAFPVALTTPLCDDIEKRVMASLHSVDFVSQVITHLDLEASAPFKFVAIVYSPSMEEAEETKCKAWVAKVFQVEPDQRRGGWPGRLALLSAALLASPERVKRLMLKAQLDNDLVQFLHSL